MKRFFYTRRAAALVPAAVFLAALCCGCGKLIPSAREINDFQLITAVGMDRHEDGGVTLTLSSKKGGTSASGGAAADAGSAPFLLSHHAATAALAFQDMESLTDKHIFLGHTRCFLIGESLARDGLRSCLDYIMRDMDVRPDVRLYIVKSRSAGELLAEASDNEEFAADRLKSMELDARRASNTDIASALDIAAAMEGGGAALIPALTLKAREGAASGDTDKRRLTFDPDGFAVIREHRLTDYIDAADAPFVNLLRGRFYNAVVEVEDARGAAAALHISRVKRSYSLEWENGAPSRLNIGVTFHSEIGQSRPESGHEGWHKYAAARLIRDGVGRAFDAARESGADYLGTAAALDMRHPFRFAPYRDGWDDIISGLEVEIRVCSKE
ncbi:MAG: hypothetical protein FWH06_04645 [Oscillospiraceae bacterium]|nr:hypothetical protein [Oscillospiraceae bacterium]